MTSPATAFLSFFFWNPKYRQVAATLRLHSHPHPPGSDIVAGTCVHADETQTPNRLLTINTTFPPSCGSLYCVYIQKRVLDTLLIFFLFCFEFMTVVLFSSKYLVNKLLPLFPISLPFSLCSFGFQLSC